MILCFGISATFELVTLASARLHLRNSFISAIECLGEPVDTPESDPPLLVESRSLLHGTEAERRIVTEEPREEERDRVHRALSDILQGGALALSLEGKGRHKKEA